MGFFSKKNKVSKEDKKIRDTQEMSREQVIEKNNSGLISTPLEFLNEIERTKLINIESNSSKTAISFLADFSQQNNLYNFKLKNVDYLNDADKEMLDLESIENMVSSFRMPKVSKEELDELGIEDLGKLYKQSVSEHKRLLSQIPEKREQIQTKVKEIKTKIPIIKTKKYREMRKLTDDKIKVISKEINEIRSRKEVLKEQMTSVVRKFKLLEKQITSDKVSDRTIMKTIASITDNIGETAAEGFEHFSDDGATEKSQQMYYSVLKSLRQVILSIKSEIDVLDTTEEEDLSTIKQHEFDFQLEKAAFSSLTKELNFAIKQEVDLTEKIFEHVVNTSNDNISLLKSSYNNLLIEKEEAVFEEKMKKMVESIKKTKIGIGYMDEISSIEKDLKKSKTEKFSKDSLQDLTREVELMISDLDDSPRKVSKAKKMILKDL